jgi:cephalosporin hydroxylase
MNKELLQEIIDEIDDKQPDYDEWLKEIYDIYYSPYYKLMYNLTKELQPKLCVELGVNMGRGMSSLARGCNDTIVVGVDPLRLPTINIILNICQNTKFVQKSSTDNDTIEYIKSLGKINIIHFDTEHNYGQIMNEFNAYKDVLADNAILLFDDTHACEDEVKRAVQDLPISWYSECDKLHPVCGYMVGIK